MVFRLGATLASAKEAISEYLSVRDDLLQGSEIREVEV